MPGAVAKVTWLLGAVLTSLAPWTTAVHGASEWDILQLWRSRARPLGKSAEQFYHEGCDTVCWCRFFIVRYIRSAHLVQRHASGHACCCCRHAQQKTDAQLAAANYKWALELQPSMFAANINLGNLLDTHGELEEAASYYRSATRAAPRAPLAWLNLGNTNNRMSRHKEAVAALSAAVEIDPANWQGSLNLGNSLCGLGDLPRVVELYRALVARNPQMPEYVFRL
eukprot:SAG11_NODE_5698_length_1484_cov_1.132130_1_plen_225_part_00